MSNTIHIIEDELKGYGVALNESPLEFAKNVLEASYIVERLIKENNLEPTDQIEIEEIEWGEDSTTVDQWQRDSKIKADHREQAHKVAVPSK